MKDLEKTQHNILTQLLEIPESTPYVGILMETGIWLMESRVHYRKLMLYHRLIHSDEKRTIKIIIGFQKEYERREGTWYSDVMRICSIYDITCDVYKSRKSEWKREVKTKIGTVNRQKVVQSCSEGVKTRFVCNNEWGRKKYLDEGTVEEVKRIMKFRLCMVVLPCNQRRKEAEPGCTLCGETKKIRMEHYFSCRRLVRMRDSLNIMPDEEQYMNGTMHHMGKGARYMETVSKLVVF